MKKLLFLLLPILPLAAAEPTLSDQLRDALYTEEVTRDPAKAAEIYEKILTTFDRQRPLAASALFRLAEIRRNAGDKKSAIALYQRLLQDFPDREAEIKLAREHLTTLGAEIPEAGTPSPDTIELQRLRDLARFSPDLILSPETLNQAIKQGAVASVRYLLEDIGNPGDDDSLAIAVESGNLTICILLLQHQKPSPTVAGSALRSAILSGHTIILELLLDSGIDPNAPIHLGRSRSSALIEAVEKNDRKAIELLLNKGADIDYMIPSEKDYPYNNQPFGTALHTAVFRGLADLVALLLEKGANPDLATPKAGITPLHLACHGISEASMHSFQLLMEASADPNSLTLVEAGPGSALPSNSPWIEATPLTLALNPIQASKVEALIKAGAKPRSQDLVTIIENASLETLQQLLENGLDPNSRTDEDAPLLVLAINSNSLDSVNALLEAGADPNTRFSKLQLYLGQGCADPFAESPGETLHSTQTLLYRASGRDTAAIFKRFLEAGAQPGPELSIIIDSVARWDESGDSIKKLLAFKPDRFNPDEIPSMSDWTPAAREAYLRDAVYPALTQSDQIAFLLPGTGTFSILASDIDPASPPSFAHLFLDHFNLFTQPQAATGDTIIHWCDYQLVRPDQDGSFIEQAIPLLGTTPFPALRGGDLIIATLANDDNPLIGWESDRTDRSAIYQWSVRKRISFPITLTIGDESHEITLRGDRLVYDPTKQEAPILPAGPLAELIWKRELHYQSTKDQNLSITRSAWPNFVINPTSPEWRTFDLEPGDEITLLTPETASDPFLGTRNEEVTLEVAGTGVIRTYPQGDSFNPFPTLVEALTDFYSPWNLKVSDLPSDPQLRLATIYAIQHREKVTGTVRNLASIGVPSVPPHPDFSSVRIHRIDHDRKETVITVDLSKSIDSTSADTTDDEARKLDFQLQRGDRVELSLLKSSDPWKGFTTEQARFFSKVLSGRILVTDHEKSEPGNLDWQPVNWVRSPSGLLPFRPESGNPSTRAESLFGQRKLSVTRDGRELERVDSNLFIRKGDQIRLGPSTGSRIRIPRKR